MLLHHLHDQVHPALFGCTRIPLYTLNPRTDAQRLNNRKREHMLILLGFEARARVAVRERANPNAECFISRVHYSLHVLRLGKLAKDGSYRMPTRITSQQAREIEKIDSRVKFSVSFVETNTNNSYLNVPHMTLDMLQENLRLLDGESNPKPQPMPKVDADEPMSDNTTVWPKNMTVHVVEEKPGELLQKNEYVQLRYQWTSPNPALQPEKLLSLLLVDVPTNINDYVTSYQLNDITFKPDAPDLSDLLLQAGTVQVCLPPVTKGIYAFHFIAKVFPEQRASTVPFDVNGDADNGVFCICKEIKPNRYSGKWLFCEMCLTWHHALCYPEFQTGDFVCLSCRDPHADHFGRVLELFASNYRRKEHDKTTSFCSSPLKVQNVLRRIMEQHSMVSPCCADLGAGLGALSICLPPGTTTCYEIDQGRFEKGKELTIGYQWVNESVTTPDFSIKNKSRFDVVVSNPDFEIALESLYITSKLLKNENSVAVFLLPSSYFETKLRAELYLILGIQIVVSKSNLLNEC